MPKSKFESTLFKGPKVDYTKPPAKGKKRIVIAWNEHPSESPVAGLHARRVANLLVKEHGDKYEVIVHKIPFKETNMGIVRDQELSEDEAKAKLSKLLESMSVSKQLSKWYGSAFVFNFHASPSGALKSDSSWVRGFSPYGQFVVPIDKSNEYSLTVEKKGKCHVVEVPAVYSLQYARRNARIPGRQVMLNRVNKLIEAHGPKNFYDKFFSADVLINSLKEDYQKKVTKLSKSGQNRFTNPAVSRKIAVAIHDTVRGIANFRE